MRERSGERSGGRGVEGEVRERSEADGRRRDGEEGEEGE